MLLWKRRDVEKISKTCDKLLTTTNVGPDCWVSVQFLHAIISRKGSGSTTTNVGRTVVKICKIYFLLKQK